MLATATIPFTHFELPAQILVMGIVTGLIYGLLGVGLTLTYRSARVINFAHGEVGALCSGLMALMLLRWHLPYAIALLVTLAAALAVGAALEILVIRRLASAPRLVVMVATIGASQVLLAINALIPRLSFAAKSFPTPFHATLTIGGVRLQAPELMILTIVPVVSLGLAMFLQRSKVGLGARASAENVDAAQLAGVPARRISLVVWIVAAVLAMVSAVLVAPTRPLTDPQNFGASLGPSLMVRALAASLLGGLSSLPQVLTGGVVIGLTEVLVSWNYPTAGAVDVMIFVAILLSIVIRRDLSRTGRGSAVSSWSLGGAVHALEPAVAGFWRVRVARRV